MSRTSTDSTHESAHELFDRWLTYHRLETGDVTPAAPAGTTGSAADTVPEPVPEVTTESEEIVAIEELADPALGGAADAPSDLGPEIAEAPADLPAASLPPEPTGAAAPSEAPRPARRRPAAPAQTPGLVLFSPRRGARRALTVAAALLAAGAGVAGYRAWGSQDSTDIGVAGGLALALLLAWTLRKHTHGAAVSIENGVLRIVQGNSRHLFPLVGTHPPISILGEPGDRGWKVLIQRRGMPPFVVNRRMVEPGAFTEAIRHFRPEA